MSYNKCNECTDMCAWEYTHQMENTEEGEGEGGLTKNKKRVNFDGLITIIAV